MPFSVDFRKESFFCIPNFKITNFGNFYINTFVMKNFEFKNFMLKTLCKNTFNLFNFRKRFQYYYAVVVDDDWD